MRATEQRREPLESAYAAVIVDEVQDLTCIGVRMLHALAGDRPDALLLIGDGQQAVYPGGFTLAEAGVPVAGRSVVLKTNYRNGAEILSVAAKLVENDGFEDLEGVRESGRQTRQVHRQGGRTIRVDAQDESSLDVALLQQFKAAAAAPGGRLGDLAILCQTRSLAGRYCRLLAAEGIPFVTLED